ncbi:MAG: hypothetical protein CSA26_07900 [Desulfobacterales bacterium]|nr:MAG: hypothetical protein CSA26_07900 [Desulfobacterales bacterium]
MEKESEFKRLESYVERLLEAFAGIKAENQGLQEDFDKLNQENTRLRQEIETLRAEKGVVRSRVGKLISRIEGWEAEFLESLPADEADTSEEKARAAEGERESIDTESGEEGEERGGMVQSSLFVDGQTPTFRTDLTGRLRHSEQMSEQSKVKS